MGVRIRDPTVTAGGGKQVQEGAGSRKSPYMGTQRGHTGTQRRYMGTRADRHGDTARTYVGTCREMWEHTGTWAMREDLGTRVGAWGHKWDV